MCCFSQSVTSVADTRIYGRLTGTGTQYLVYQMQYQSEVPNAMILPIPISTTAHEHSVRFFRMDRYDRFFVDLGFGFPSLAPPMGRQPAVSSSIDNEAPRLQVHEVGDYVASFVPKASDFDRLDPQFSIRKEVWQKIPEYDDYGFIVFQLKELVASTQPMAFEFPTRWQDRIFFPTVHIHDGEIHDHEHFDHLLYLQHEQFDRHTGSYRGPMENDANTGFVRSKWKAKEFCNIAACQDIIDGKLLVHRLRLEGNLENRDYLPSVDAKHFSNDGRTGLSLPILPTIATLASCSGLGWLVHRRNRIRKGLQNEVGTDEIDDRSSS